MSEEKKERDSDLSSDDDDFVPGGESPCFAHLLASHAAWSHSFALTPYCSDSLQDEKQSSDEGSAVGDEEGERPAKRRRTSKAAAKEAYAPSCASNPSIVNMDWFIAISEANKAYASVDIDALWADMKASSTPSLKPTSSASSASTPTSTPQTAQPDTPKTIQPTKSAVFITSLNEFLSRSKSLGDLMASSKPEPVKKTVTETYKFAGEIIKYDFFYH